MRKVSFLLKISLVIALVAVVGCQDRSNIMEPQTAPNFNPLALPGVTIDSAMFYIYTNHNSGATVNVHKVNVAWTEVNASWNLLAGNWDGAVTGSFLANGSGWRSVDITTLVNGWLDGDFPNYGILLEQSAATIYSAHRSSEWATVAERPYLKICYTTSGGSNCVIIQDGTEGTVQDAFIQENAPAFNDNNSNVLYTGVLNGYMKMCLLQFSMPDFPQTAAIGDFVWFDDNHDGIQDLGEPGVPNVWVRLLDCTGTILDSMQTDANGLYLFSGLQPGDYKIQFVFPAGYSISPQDQGANDAVDSDADLTTGLTICTTLDGGETDLTWDMGIFLPDEHCTRTIGYWKTHDGSGPQADVVTALLPIWLGTAGGTKSINVTNTTISHRILDLSDAFYGPASNGISKLYAQLLGARLNEANDADVSLIAATMAAADAFLANYNWLDWSGLTNAQKQMVNGWMTTLDNYNNGLIGPIHCD